MIFNVLKNLNSNIPNFLCFEDIALSKQLPWGKREKRGNIQTTNLFWILYYYILTTTRMNWKMIVPSNGIAIIASTYIDWNCLRKERKRKFSWRFNRNLTLNKSWLLFDRCETASFLWFCWMVQWSWYCRPGRIYMGTVGPDLPPLTFDFFWFDFCSTY